MLLPLCLPYTSEYCTVPLAPTLDHDDQGGAVYTSLKPFNNAISEASCHILSLKRIPDPKGARWWNDAYSVAHMLA
jgi:hypothetical protein